VKNAFQLVARSGLARRTFAIIATTVLVVVLGVLWFAAHWSEQYADEQATREIGAATKRYALDVFQRLDLAASALLATPVADEGSLLSLDPRLSPFFDSVEVKPKAKGLQAQQGTGARIELRVLHDSHSPRVSLVLDSADRTVVGRLASTYVWQSETLPSEFEVRVTDHGGHTLFSQSTLDNDSTQQRAAPPSASWQLFLRERFGADAWDFQMSQVGTARTDSVIRFRSVLLASLLPTLAGIALLASVLIRRSHRPLERLIDATRQLADGHFNTRVEESGDVDSRALITSFNSMTERIARSWETMQLLSRIDRSILGACDIDPTMRLVLIEGRALLRCDRVAVLLLASGAPPRGTLVWLTASDAELERAELAISPTLLARLSAEDSMTVEASDVCWCEPTFWPAGDALHATPIRHDANVRGVVLTSRSAVRAIDPEASENQKLLSHRLAVALASYERDQALTRSAYFDDLTGLANRRNFQRHLDAKVQLSDAPQQGFALLFLDLDRFKIVNDATGHGAGDRLLRAVAERLKAKLPEDNFIARLGGDEFTVVIPGLTDPAEITVRAEGLVDALSEPITLGEASHVVSASIGIAIYPSHGRDPDTLLRNADTAMYRAKRAGSLKYAFYEAEMSANALEYVEIERDLRRAISANELRIYYQPQVDIRSGNVIGAEALLRWQHPTLGILAPERFLEVAEETGLIVPIGEWVIDNVCRQYRSWRSVDIVLDCIAINASVTQLEAKQFVAQISTAMDAYHVPRNVLDVEITETALARDIGKIAQVLQSLRAMGVRVAIDDFGVGYSSLSYLQQLPFDVLKIDRAFISASVPTLEAGSICEAIIAMGAALRKQIVAEGVENISQAQFLLTRGCFVAQGYYYAPPLAVDDFERFFCKRSVHQSLEKQTGTGF
jgi:diguanylate cyclase